MNSAFRGHACVNDCFIIRFSFMASSRIGLALREQLVPVEPEALDLCADRRPFLGQKLFVAAA